MVIGTAGDQMMINQKYILQLVVLPIPLSIKVIILAVFIMLNPTEEVAT